jgi:hypothetical protein
MQGMLTRTWAYGTKLKGVLLEKSKPRNYFVLLVQDENNEAFLILQKDDPQVEIGEEGNLTFREGGPAGGHWRFARE